MKPSKISDILDLARQIRKNDDNFYPLLVGPAGVGKSQVVQQWCNDNKLKFIDLRAAYLEAPDAIGFPSIENVNGRQTTVHNIPEFWPQDGEGVLLLEEPNRGTTSVMNVFMQLLTDRKVHKYTLPKGWMIVGCINPETEENDVNTMDVPLKNRFVTFDVSYDKKAFCEYMEAKNWNKTLRLFVESGSWMYKAPEEVGNMPGAKYVSPRTMEQLNSVLKVDQKMYGQDELHMFQAILGTNIGRDFYQFKYDESPVLFQELVKDFKKAKKRLERFCDPKDIKSGMIAVTVQDITTDGTITDELLVDVLKVLPVDHGVTLVRDLEFKRKDDKLLLRICDAYPEVKSLLKETLKPTK